MIRIGLTGSEKHFMDATIDNSDENQSVYLIYTLIFIIIVNHVHFYNSGHYHATCTGIYLLIIKTKYIYGNTYLLGITSPVWVKKHFRL